MTREEENRLVRQMRASSSDAFWIASEALSKHGPAAVSAIGKFAEQLSSSSDDEQDRLRIASTVAVQVGLEAAADLLEEVRWDHVGIDPWMIPWMVREKYKLDRVRTTLHEKLSTRHSSADYLWNVLQTKDRNLQNEAEKLAVTDTWRPEQFDGLVEAGLSETTKRQFLVAKASDRTVALFMKHALRSDDPTVRQVANDTATTHTVRPEDFEECSQLGLTIEAQERVLREGVTSSCFKARYLQLMLNHPLNRLRAEAQELASPDNVEAYFVPDLLRAGLATTTLRRVIREVLASGNPYSTVGFLPYAITHGDNDLREAAWTCLSSPNKAVRHAAAKVLGESTLPVVERATNLLVDKAAGTREAAARLLATRGDEPARRVLLDRLPNEPKATVRAEIVGGLLDAGVSPDAVADAMGPATPEELEERGRAVRKLGWTWLDEVPLPPLQWTDGRPVDPAAVRLMLYAQSRQKRPMPEPELMPLYRQIDRHSSADFALTLLDLQQKGDRHKATAWAMIPVGLLGDNRAVAQLVAAVRKHAKKYDEKVFGFAIHALALNGTDAAISAVAGNADAYRDAAKLKHRKAAAVADRVLDRLAITRGMTRAELEDATLPTFGFPTDGTPRRIIAGKRTIDARISTDFKLVMTDAETGKRVASVPKAAGEAIVGEFKGLRKMLGEVAKQQTARLERLMVDGQRWDGRVWSERLLGHPMLLPFAQRLVWATFDESDRPTQLLRALPDRTLTDADDEAVEPPTAGERVGIVHPLLLEADVASAWREHLADYEVEPPFEQLDRPTARVPPDLRDAEIDGRLKDESVGLLSLRAKLQKHGWTLSYDHAVRRFEKDGVIARLTVRGAGEYYYGGDSSQTVPLGNITFHKAEDVQAVAEDGNDTRPVPRLPLGVVPPIVYSETVGRLRRIAGIDDVPGAAA
jgi:hypothetical protein